MLSVITDHEYTGQVLERFKKRDSRLKKHGKISPNDRLDLHFVADKGKSCARFLQNLTHKGSDFWTASVEQREEFLTHLINREGGAQKFLQSYDTEIQGFLQAFFPAEKGQNQIARKLYSKYLSKAFVDDYQLAVCLQALLHSLQKGNTEGYQGGDAVSFGYRLGDFLLGIGATKFAQKLDSFRYTPPEWKEGLSLTKDGANPMTDAEFKARAEEVLEESNSELLEAITIGEPIGTGTYLDTREVTIKPKYLKKHSKTYEEAPEGSEFVLQLVKPGEVMHTNVMLDLAQRLSKLADKNDDPASRFIKSLTPILEYIEETNEEETNMKKAKKKAKAFAELYKGVQLLTPDLNVEFRPAMIFDHDKEYRVNLRCKGKHFADLKEDTKKSKQTKIELAMAITIMELYILLSGQAFDHDRHDKNQRIKVLDLQPGAKRRKVIIGNFDENGLVGAPTRKQKRLLANLLMDAVEASVIDGDNIIDAINEVFLKAQREADDHNQKEYIAAVADAVVALMNYTKYFAEPGYEKANVGGKLLRIRSNVNKVLTIAQIIKATGAVDPDIEEVIVDRAAKLRKKKFIQSLQRSDFQKGSKLRDKMVNRMVLKWASMTLSASPKQWALKQVRV